MLSYSELYSLEGKTALITGASGGLGMAIAEVFASAGARLILSDYNQARTDAALNVFAGRDVEALGLPVDLGDLATVRKAATGLVVSGHVPDCLVLNGGIQGPAGPIGHVGDADWQRVMTVNLASAHAMTSVLAPAMAERGGGSMIVMASIAALRGNKNIGLYGLTKAALTQLVRNLAVEWGPANLRANAIAPGLIRTPLAEDLMNNAEFMQRRLSMTPLRRVGEPEEIAGIALMLASRAGGFITGQTIIADGGTLVSDGS